MGVVTSGLVGYWHYAQGVNGSTWQNIAPATQGQYNGTITGAVLQSDGVYFNGVDNYVNVGAFPPLASLSSFTFQVLITAPVDTNTRAAFAIYNDNTNRWLLGYNTSQKAQYSVTEGNVGKSLSGNAIVASDVLLTVTSSPTGRKIYLGTNLDKSDTLSSSMLTASLNNLVIGCGFFNTLNYYFSGKIRAVRVYNRELTAAEVTQNYNLAYSDIGIVVANNYTASLLDSINSTDVASKYFAKDVINDNMTSMDTQVKQSSLNVNEELYSSDNVYKDIQYLKSESILIADEKYMAITKEVNDIVNTEDTFSSKLARMITLIDNIYAAEDHLDQTGNLLTDSVILEDTIIKNLEKIQADYISTGDIEEDLYHKILTEAISPTDNFATVLTQYRHLFDTVKITDAIVSVGNNKEKLIDLLLSTEITRVIQLSTKIEREIQLSAEITKEIHLSLFL